MPHNPTTSLASVTDNYLLYTDKPDLANKPEPFHNHDVVHDSQVSYPVIHEQTETVITVIETPAAVTQQVNNKEEEQTGQPAPEWDILTSFYYSNY